MRTSPRTRDKLGLGNGKDRMSMSSPRISHAPTTSPPRPSSAKSPPSSSLSSQPDAMSSDGSRLSSRAASVTASEIIVQSEAMDLDDSVDHGSPAPSPDGAETSPPASETFPASEAAQVTTSDPNSAHPQPDSLESPLSDLSDQSELSNVPASVSSKATTPVDLDGAREMVMPPTQPSPPRQVPRRTFNVAPKSSIPLDLDGHTYASQCIQAAESSRLDPFALHQEEYEILRRHITHAQVTTYLNIRNAILRIWINNPRVPVTREEAAGCAGARWFDVASVCFDWLARHGYINYGCVEYPENKPRQPESQGPEPGNRKTIVVIGGGISGLSCARQLEGLARQYSDRFLDNGELPPKIIVLEGRGRVGGRVYSRELKTIPSIPNPDYTGQRHTAEMGGMIITGFERGNPLNVLVRGQLGLGYRALVPDTTIYDSNGRPVDINRDYLVEQLYNDCLDRVSEFKYKSQPSKLIRGSRTLIELARDSNSDGGKTISQSEEAAAALPDALPVSQQNVPARVNRVPVSFDKVTGRVHTEPGTPATQKASEKAKAMGWTLKDNVSPEATIDLAEAAAKEESTLGSVLDEAISQYKTLVDLTAQDHRLLNWHVANLEYSNATNLHKLSLGSWDIDAGNEWEGKHTMVVGGYQGVARGLARSPAPLDVKTKLPVQKITYDAANASGKAVVECEGGVNFEADYIVSTIPLGVLKQPGSVAFDPPLPQWKADAIGRIGFGVLNKVILVYKQPFWDTSRNIFGVLRDAVNRHSLNQSEYALQRGRFFQWFNVTGTTGLPCLVALMAGDAGFNTEHESNDMLIEEATGILRSVFGRTVPYPVEAIVTRWESDKFARGSYSSAAPEMHPNDYNDMARPVGNLFFAGEHTIGTHPATVHGAYMSGLRAASEVLESMLGPIDVPTPLVVPKDSVTPSLKRKESNDPEQARLDAYETAAWGFIVSKIGHRPFPPSKLTCNAYLLYNKANYEAAKRRCEEERSNNNSKRKVGPNDVRVMTSRMWKSCALEERKTYEEEAARVKEEHARAVVEFNDKSTKWDQDYVSLREQYEKEHPFVGDGVGGGSSAKHKRTGKMVDYAESDGNGSDVDL